MPQRGVAFDVDALTPKLCDRPGIADPVKALRGNGRCRTEHTCAPQTDAGDGTPISNRMVRPGNVDWVQSGRRLSQCQRRSESLAAVPVVDVVSRSTEVCRELLPKLRGKRQWRARAHEIPENLGSKNRVGLEILAKPNRYLRVLGVAEGTKELFNRCLNLRSAFSRQVSSRRRQLRMPSVVPLRRRRPSATTSI